MTPRNRILVIITLFLVPILVRTIFFYQLPYWNASIKIPDYTIYHVSEPPTPSSRLKPVGGVADGKIVLVDNNHSNQFRPDEVEPLLTALSVLGGRVEFDQSGKSLQSQLKYASAYIVFSPTDSYTGQEILDIQQFIASGGRLLIFTDPTHNRVEYDVLGNATTFFDVNYANPLIAPFGLSFVNDYLYNLTNNEGNFRNVEFTDFAENQLTQDLNMVAFYGAHTVHTRTGTVLANGNANTLSSLTDRGGGLTSMALSTDGQVLAIGDFTFLTNPFNQVADNNLLLSNLASFALGGKRTPLLANFPFVFEHPVSLITSGDMELTSDLLGPIATLQQSLKTVNIPLRVNTRLSTDNDAIILGTFNDIDVNLAHSVEPFGINGANNPAGPINIPGFGKVSRSGNGLLLFNHGPETNSLILLADTTDNFPKLIGLVAGGDLSACVIQGTIGVCSLGSTSSDEFGSGPDGFYETPTPLAGQSTPMAP